MPNQETKNVFRRLDETLATAGRGLADIRSGNPERRISGIRNLIVFGRAVTNVLQNLRSIEPGFDEWYAPYLEEMKADPLLRFFYKLRSEVLKEGKVITGVSAHIRSFGPGDMRKFGPPPPNAKSFFIGDQYGGTGWEVDLGDGTTGKYYVDLPPEIGQTEIFFSNAPTEHLGKPLEEKSVEVLSQMYFDYLVGLVTSAKKELGNR